MPWLDAIGGDSRALAARLQAIPGVGIWTANTVVHSVCGDEDAVPVGDYHLPSIVSFALTGRARARDDGFMLELLEPYRPFRGRVARLLAAGGPKVPRRAPRMAIDGALRREAGGRRR
jgi:3-methyladenine DNA glycosylase/8-oxoguanine DNA glycosylase